ncbi:MAG: class I SAM-dependent methyltransferase [Spirochaetales bacterium]|nr:class I SAM-dependent methyltransferase [Spirochaetales bacterium]
MSDIKERVQTGNNGKIISEMDLLEYFNSKAYIWDHICSHDPEKLTYITELCSIMPGDRVLDIACGTGVMASHLIGTDADFITGIDLSNRMIEQARRKFSDPRLNFKVGNIYDFSTPCWNVAIIYSALPHFMDRIGLVNKLSRLLVQGGRFIVAHSESSRVINRVHNNQAQAISIELRSAAEESQVFRSKFNIDTLIDTDELYVFSGTLN